MGTAGPEFHMLFAHWYANVAIYVAEAKNKLREKQEADAEKDAEMKAQEGVCFAL